MTSFNGFLYHGSKYRFDEFETYEVRFSPRVNIPLAYATKKSEGYLYEMKTRSKIPNILSISSNALISKLIELRNTLGAPTLETKYDYQYRNRDSKLGNISSEWDDVVASLCEYEHVNGISMPKNENQIMLCRRVVKKYLKVNRIFKVVKKPNVKGYEIQQIVPAIEEPFHLSNTTDFPYPPEPKPQSLAQKYRNRIHLPPKMRKYTYKTKPQIPAKLRKYNSFKKIKL